MEEWVAIIYLCGSSLTGKSSQPDEPNVLVVLHFS